MFYRLIYSILYHYNNAKRSVLNKAGVLYEIFPLLQQAEILIHFLNLLIVTELLLLWNRKER